MRIIETGVMAAPGHGVALVSAAARGGVNAASLIRNFRLRATGAPVQAMAVEALSPVTVWADRVAWLASQAVAQLAASLAMLYREQPIAQPKLFLSLPTPRPGLPDGYTDIMMRAVTAGIGMAVDRAGSAIVRSGQDGALACLAAAQNALAIEQPAAAVVGGVDSWMDIDMLHWLESQRRLKSASSPNGFRPGEAAAFLLLVNDSMAARAPDHFLVACAAQSRAAEPDPWYTQRPCTATGLTIAIQQAFAAAPAARADITICDLNGESWRSEEWGFAYIRTARHHGEPLNIWHPADACGDTGAATGALLVALAAHELARDRSLRRALVWCASDVTPYRSAVIVDNLAKPSDRGMWTWQ